jgi:hypothetical protein
MAIGTFTSRSQPNSIIPMTHIYPLKLLRHCSGMSNTHKKPVVTKRKLDYH